MLKKAIALFSFLFLFSSGKALAFDEKIDIRINGEYIYTDSEVLIENGVSLAPVRFVGNALGAKEINWYQNAFVAELDMGSKEIFIDINKDIVYIDSSPYTFNADAKIVNNRTYIPVRLICELLGASVNWDNRYKNIDITMTNHKTPASAIDTTYNDDDLLWLSRIIFAESSGEPLSGKIAVGNVILNRVESTEYPNTIYGVIFDRNHGVQFEPTLNGAIYNTPDSESIKAAKHALSGTNTAGKSLYFFNPKTAQSNWISKNRPYYMTIANHDFYL